MSVPRVAVVHHWFVSRGGGERVAECLAALLPSADLFTLVADPQALPATLRTRKIHTSWLQRMPGAVQRHRHWMPLYPEAARSLDLRAYDLVVSSDAGPVKGVWTSRTAIHICYCHSPMRYLYDSYESYRAEMPLLTRTLFTWTAGRVRRADLKAARRVSQFVANSHYISERIRRIYGRASEVIYPPIDLDHARISTPGEHYLCAGRLVPYKRTDLAVLACKRLGRKLRIVGSGPEMERLRRLAGSETEFLGELSTEALFQQYSQCRALLFAADEDFGMVPLEAQSCGRPVIAFGHGGSLETVRAGGVAEERTGLYFGEQTVDSVLEAILRFESQEGQLRPEAMLANAARFGTPIFLQRMHSLLRNAAPFAESLLATPEMAASIVR